MRRKLIGFIILIIYIAIGIGIIRSVYTLSQKKGIITERQQVLRELTEKNRQLQEDLQEATSPAFIEQAARDKLGLVREGETVVIMDKSHPPAGGLNDQKNPQELPSWKQWWKLFF
jgi:cell division protein FtsB